MLSPLHHDVNCNIVFARGGLAIKEGRQELGSDDHLHARNVNPAHTHLQNIICSASYRLGRIGLAAGSYKLLKDKALVLVVHALSKYEPI